MLTSAKLRKTRSKKIYFIKLHIGAYLRAKFEVSNIILTGFRQRESKQFAMLTLKSPPRLGLT